MMEKILTYKGTDKDMKCRGMQYEIGKTEKSDDAICCGNKGFHACEAPFDVIRYYPNRNGNRFFSAESGGKIDRDQRDTKIASSEITLKAEIGFSGLVKAQIEYTRKKAESGKKGGNGSNIAGGAFSNLSGGDRSNLSGGYRSNLSGGYRSNLAGGSGSNLSGGDRSNLSGGDRSNLAGGSGSNLAGGSESNLSGGNFSNLAGGSESNLSGGDRSNLSGGDRSNLSGGDRSNLVGRILSNLAGGENCVLVGDKGSRAKGKKGTIIVLLVRNDHGEIVDFKVGKIDGESLKEDVFYKLENGEFVEVKEEDK